MSLVFDFDARHDIPGTDLARLLGGKGAELNVMAVELGLPVPPAFTISADACRAYLGTGWPDGLDVEIRDHLAALERRVGRCFGDASDPLLVSVRSGAVVSMPGMMDTILDLGLNDATTSGLARATGSPGFAADCRRRFEEMFRAIVGVDEIPDDPWAQLRAAIEAVFRSWNGDRAIAYRRRERIPDDLGTAVTVQAMVFGNRDADSGSGVLFTRDPATGARTMYGDVLFGAQGEDVVAGTHRTSTLAELTARLPHAAADLQRHATALERHHADMCDIEFTVESGRLWLLQCRIAKRSPQAALRMAVEMAEDAEFPLARQEAVERVAALLADPPRLIARPATHATPMTTGLPASPGMASGEVVTSPDRAVALADAGLQVILVRAETSPDDVHGMARAAGLLTSHGGLASHAAVVARGWGIPAVVGAADLLVGDGTVAIAGSELASGTRLTIDGSTGSVYEGVVTGIIEEPPEVATLRRWAAELGVEIDPTGTSSVPAESDLRSPISVDRETLLTILAIKGFSTAEGLAETLSTSLAVARSALDGLAAAALLDAGAGSFGLSANGRLAADAALAADRDRWGSARAASALDAFAGFDQRVKEVVTAWQLREVDGSQSANDHGDPAYDRQVLDRLHSVHDEAADWLSPLGASVPRMELYRARLARALELATAGDVRYVASPRVDSYHSAWFELHEDLIRLCGRTRADEAAAGRA